MREGSTAVQWLAAWMWGARGQRRPAVAVAATFLHASQAYSDKEAAGRSGAGGSTRRAGTARARTEGLRRGMDLHGTARRGRVRAAQAVPSPPCVVAPWSQRDGCAVSVAVARRGPDMVQAGSSRGPGGARSNYSQRYGPRASAVAYPGAPKLVRCTGALPCGSSSRMRFGIVFPAVLFE